MPHPLVFLHDGEDDPGVPADQDDEAQVPAKPRKKSQRNQLQRPERGTDQHDVVDTIAQNR